jgi:AmmeMemoRadiSam system protein B
MSEGPARPPAVAELFYPADRGRLLHLIDSLTPKPRLEEHERENALAALAPHAGLMYSGRVAAGVFSRLRIPPVAVILCFNHRGAGATFSVWPGAAWETPLGRSPIDAALRERLRSEYPPLEPDARAHEGEHSGELQLVFLQYFRPDIRVVPVSLNAWRDAAGFDALRAFGEALGRAVAAVGVETLVVASSDMNHYEGEETTRYKDRLAIEAMCSLDPVQLRDTIAREEISMCGYAPAVAAMVYARARGGRRGRLLVHATSGDVTGDRERVVGYAGILFE